MDTTVVNVQKTYKARMYRNDEVDQHLFQLNDIAGIIWNHVLALQKRYYKLTGKYIQPNDLKKHITKLYNRSPKYAFWKLLGSQARQDVIERLHQAYRKFFKKEAGLPRFKKVKKYKSFTLKQSAGYQLLSYNKNNQKANGKYTRER